MASPLKAAGLCVALLCLHSALQGAPGAADTVLVSVGSPPDLTPRNHQNEPAIAIDASNPQVLVAGANDNIDQQPCPFSLAIGLGSCQPASRSNAGLSAVYFSFDGGHSWIQPTYTGWTLRDCAGNEPCAGHVGAIGTLPWYYESGLVSFGDPAVAVGPRPVNGQFSWANGSRVYYASLAANFGAVREPTSQGTVKGLLGVAVSHLDNATPARVLDQNNWSRPVQVTTRAGNYALEDKDQIWADNATSSPYFGRVYTCHSDFRSNGAAGFGPFPVVVARSVDGGETWTAKKLPGNPSAGGSLFNHGYLNSCTIRTDSSGGVYVFVARFSEVLRDGGIVLYKSLDGGEHWAAEQSGPAVNDMCYQRDPIHGQCVMDGFAGARTQLAAAPGADIANGAPTGLDATNAIVLTWSDGRFGFGQEKTLFSWSLNGGASWNDPVVASVPTDRAMYSAPAISPSGDRVYVVYQGVTSPWRGSDMTLERLQRGVFRTAPFGPLGPGDWTTAHDGVSGDLRGTFPGHDLYQERVGDYVYAAATRDYGIGVWTDVRNASACQAVQAYRAKSWAEGGHALPGPWPLGDCPATFGNADIVASVAPAR